MAADSRVKRRKLLTIAPSTESPSYFHPESVCHQLDEHRNQSEDDTGQAANGVSSDSAMTDVVDSPSGSSTARDVSQCDNGPLTMARSNGSEEQVTRPKVCFGMVGSLQDYCCSGGMNYQNNF